MTKLDPPEPGTYTEVTYICDEDWGKNCSSGNIGVTPISPDRLQNVVVASTAPTLRWVPSSIPDVKYDVAIYEAYDSKWRKIVLDVLTGNKKGSIREWYASPCYGGSEAGSVIGTGGEADEVEPAQVVVQIAGGDAAAGTQEVLQPAVAAVHRLHMQIAPNPFPIERLSASWLTPSAAAQGG